MLDLLQRIGFAGLVLGAFGVLGVLFVEVTHEAVNALYAHADLTLYAWVGMSVLWAMANGVTDEDT